MPHSMHVKLSHNAAAGSTDSATNPWRQLIQSQLTDHSGVWRDIRTYRGASASSLCDNHLVS
jgi:hypothetical protein